MSKVIIIIILSVFSLNLFSQEEDSSYYEDDFVKDTTAIWHIGFSVGGSIQSLLYTANTVGITTDSIDLYNSKPNTGFVLGIIVERDFSDKLWLRSGFNINISKMNIVYKYRNDINNYYFNYSSIEIPFWLQYAFKNKRRGLSWGMGLKPTLDISRSLDYNNRLFELHKITMLAGTGPSLRWQINSGSWINLSLGVNIGVFNVFKNSNNIYNNSVEKGRPWQVQLLISMN